MFLLMFLIGCGSNQVRIRTEVQEVYVPLLYCPAPPVIERPILPIHQMTEEQLQDPGIVVQHYKATVKILQGYSEELETTVKQYDKANDAYQELRTRFQENWKQDLKDAKKVENQ